MIRVAASSAVHLDPGDSVPSGTCPFSASNACRVPGQLSRITDTVSFEILRPVNPSSWGEDLINHNIWGPRKILAETLPRELSTETASGPGSDPPRLPSFSRLSVVRYMPLRSERGRRQTAGAADRKPLPIVTARSMGKTRFLAP